jgi:hypothetical protein
MPRKLFLPNDLDPILPNRLPNCPVMKSFLLFTLILLGFGVGANAQQRILRQSIDDNGRKLLVEIDLERDGEPQRYRGRFDVSHLDKAGKKALLNHLLDSLRLPRLERAVAFVEESGPALSGVASRPSRGVATASPVPLSASLSPAAPFAAKTGTVVGAERGLPYTKTVEEDPATGRLRLRYEYQREGDERVFERILDVRCKSKSEKKRLIEETDQLFSLGLVPPAY